MLTATLQRAEELAEAEELLCLPQGGDWAFAQEMPRGAAVGLGTLGERVHVVVLRDGDRPVAVGVRAVKRVRWQGAPAQLGYLGLLRRRPDLPLTLSHRALGMAFAALAQTRTADELPFDLTAIAQGNRRAQRLLTASLSGVPSYRPCATYAAWVWRRTRLARGGSGRCRIRPASFQDVSALAALGADGCVLAPAAPSDITGLLVAEDAKGVAACGRLRDLRQVRSTRVARVPRLVALARPLINPLRALRGRCFLPTAGQQIDAQHLVDWRWRPGAVSAALAVAAALARSGDAAVVIAGWSEAHPDAPALARWFPPADVVPATWYTVGEHPAVSGVWHLESDGL